MPERKHHRSSLILVGSWLLFLWLVFAIDLALRLCRWGDHPNGIWLADRIGLRPHSVGGLWGIPGCHILHANLHHLLSNSIGLLILGLVSCWYSQRLTLLAILYSAVCSATLTWLIAPTSSVHIGASGIIFGLIGFLVCNGLFRGSWGAFFIAIPIAVFASGVIPGMFPTAQNQAQLISWQMHLGGFLGGAIASWQLRHEKAA